MWENIDRAVSGTRRDRVLSWSNPIHDIRFVNSAGLYRSIRGRFMRFITLLMGIVWLSIMMSKAIPKELTKYESGSYENLRFKPFFAFRIVGF